MIDSTEPAKITKVVKPLVVVPVDDDEVLNYTHAVRKQLVEYLIEDGPPTDQKKQTVLLAALTDMDRAALSKKKIKVEEGLGSAQAQAAEAIAMLFSDPRVKTLVVAPGVGAIQRLASDIPVPNTITGELGDNDENLDYTSFTTGSHAK